MLYNSSPSIRIDCINLFAKTTMSLKEKIEWFNTALSEETNSIARYLLANNKKFAEAQRDFLNKSKNK